MYLILEDLEVKYLIEDTMQASKFSDHIKVSYQFEEDVEFIVLTPLDNYGSIIIKTILNSRRQRRYRKHLSDRSESSIFEYGIRFSEKNLPEALEIFKELEMRIIFDNIGFKASYNKFGMISLKPKDIKSVYLMLSVFKDDIFKNYFKPYFDADIEFISNHGALIPLELIYKFYYKTIKTKITN